MSFVYVGGGGGETRFGPSLSQSRMGTISGREKNICLRFFLSLSLSHTHTAQHLTWFLVLAKEEGKQALLQYLSVKNHGTSASKWCTTMLKNGHNLSLEGHKGTFFFLCAGRHNRYITHVLLSFLFFRLKSWTRCRTNSAGYVMSLPQVSTLVPSPVRAASPFLAGPATTSQSSRNARTTTAASSIRKIALPARPAGCESA